MHWYVLRTISGQEEKSLLLLQHLFKDIKFIFPKRRLSWRKKGAILDVVKPLFRGYLFVSADDQKIKELDFWLRDKKVDIWFVKTGKLIISITNEEVELIKQLVCNGDILERSQIVKIGERVQIVDGPLVGLEGIIEKYSRRDRRILIKVNIGGEEKRVELEGIWIEGNNH